jgi:hypothetical protein
VTQPPHVNASWLLTFGRWVDNAIGTCVRCSAQVPRAGPMDRQTSIDPAHLHRVPTMDIEKPAHPGVEVATLMRERNITYAMFGYSRISPAMVREIIDGECSIPSDPAQLGALAKILRVEPRFLRDLQTTFNKHTKKRADSDVAKRDKYWSASASRAAKLKTKRLAKKVKQ